MTKIVSLEYQEKVARPTYANIIYIITYLLTTECYGTVNKYEIEARIRGIENADPYLELVDCRPLTNNEGTLQEHEIIDLLDW